MSNAGNQFKEAIHDALEVIKKLRADMGFAITDFTSEGGEIVLADDTSDCEEMIICP